MEKVIVILGQTAVGKTSMSIKLAKALNSEIINGDAMQVYKEFNILTDKITNQKQENIPHHLLNIKSIKENYNVDEYQHNIRKIIKQLNQKNIIPIVVGGTGLYIKAALYDYTFLKENISNIEMEKLYQDKTNDELYEMLLKIDKEAALKIHKNNRRRVIRALSIYKETGQTKTEILTNQKHELIYDALIIGLYLDKEQINQQIDKRIDEMFKNNVIEEVKNNITDSTASKAIGYQETGQTKTEILTNQKHELIYDALIIGLYLDKEQINQQIDKRIDEMFKNNVIEEVKNNITDSTASKAIGYQEISKYLKNELSLDETISLMKIHTHQYAKRQKTFFKNQFADMIWIKNDENALNTILKIINDKWFCK